MMGRRWLVDAMNVIGSRPDRWWNDPDGAMVTLVASLERFARATGDDVTVVFDKDPGGLPGSGPVVAVVASRRGRNAADHEIVDIVARAEDPSALWVVTSDKWLRRQVEELGAHVVPSKSFRDRLDESS